MNGGPEDGAPEPTDPITAAQEGALAIHSMFLNYVAAGFSEHQACVIIGTWLAVIGQGGRGDES